MNIKLLEILRCPECASEFDCNVEKEDDKGRIITGKLTCQQCNQIYPILRSIPRFIPIENYARSFGYQWNLYKYTQVDQYSHITHSQDRFYSETNWQAEDLKDDWVLDVGCGNGRFLEVVSQTQCQVVGVDLSSAIDAAGELFQDKSNVHLVQASIYKLPFKKPVFDKCYCIGVIQHTPDVQASLRALPQYVKLSGKLAVTIYERKPWTIFYGKYLLRPITKRLNDRTLLTILKILSPLLFTLTEILYRIPVFKKIFTFVIPYANHVGIKALSTKQRYEWAILDTFDMLSPAYDSPMTENEVRNCLAQSGVTNIKRLANPGVNIIAEIK